MEITGVITAVVVGLIIGALGRLVVPGRQRLPIWLTLAIGVVAALAGTVIASVVGFGDTQGIDWLEVTLQVGLAALAIALLAGLLGNRHSRH